MINYKTSTVPGTNSTHFLKASIGAATILLTAPMLDLPTEKSVEPTQNRGFEIIGAINSSTTSIQHYEVLHPSDSIKNIVSSFYSSLLLSQKQIGETFEKVLFDNLEDLYET
jgi:hypothetical protein